MVGWLTLSLRYDLFESDGVYATLRNIYNKNNTVKDLLKVEKLKRGAISEKLSLLINGNFLIAKPNPKNKRNKEYFLNFTGIKDEFKEWLKEQLTEGKKAVWDLKQLKLVDESILNLHIFDSEKGLEFFSRVYSAILEEHDSFTIKRSFEKMIKAIAYTKESKIKKWFKKNFQAFKTIQNAYNLIQNAHKMHEVETMREYAFTHT